MREIETRISKASSHHLGFRKEPWGKTHLRVAKLCKLGLGVFDSVEDSRVLAQEVSEGLSVGRGLACSDLAEVAR